MDYFYNYNSVEVNFINTHKLKVVTALFEIGYICYFTVTTFIALNDKWSWCE